MDSGIMQPTRRRKKRPNYGTRTVEVFRGKNGFGFTISGQQPCILSSIVPNSPADRADLRPGDYLMAVSGQNVSKALHDDVVQLIGNCHGILKLQIAENYYSDSSEEDLVMTIRQKPKYLYKYKHNVHNTHPFIQAKPHKYNNSTVDSCSAFDDKFEVSKSTSDNVYNRKSSESVSLSSHTYNEIENTQPASLENNCLLQCIVGYLGTIEMPKKLTPVSRHQVVRGCIKRLRAEKRNYTAVMMTVFPCSLRLKNDSCITIAVYPGGRVTFCSANNEQNRRYFGVVTTSVSEEPSNSCHVFVALNILHQEHSKLASKFGVTCSTSISGECNFFPNTCDSIVNAVRKYYEDQRGNNDSEEPLVANSPQPSNDSSVTTSNSDSGIGFRDESGHQSDRILLVDIQNQRLHIQAGGLPDPQYIDCCAEKSDRSSSNTNPSLPVLNEKHQLNFLNDNESSDNIYQWNSKPMYNGNVLNNRLSCKSFDDLATPVSSFILNGSLERRLSPKVFVNTSDMMPVSQSLENLKTQSDLYEDLEPPDSFLKKHSLQDLTAYSAESVAQGQQRNEPMEAEQKVTSWATSLETLLSDVVGLHAFAEFLEKEFSSENIYFWVACEKYKITSCVEERKKLAQSIYDRFLANNASEPVNVDSSGKHLTPQQLQTADLNLLQNAQKQIFNLMKFDSYTRFLKSEVYKNYLMREIAGETIIVPPNTVNSDLLIQSPQKIKNTKENTEESERNHRSSRRRRSLLPWSRSRCKSRDRTTSIENASSCGGSHTSLASWDLAVPVSLCRVILPDSSWAVLNIQPQESVHDLITSKLLEKRSMPHDNFQVILTATDKVVDLKENAAVLSGKEVKIEWRIEFRLDLPDRKSLTVKSKPSHTLGAVLGPILVKHGYNLQMVTLCLMSENEVLEPNTLVGAVDKQRIQVLTRNTPTPNLPSWNYYGCNVKPQKQTGSTLDEITNKVFEELLNGKAENYRNPVSETVPSTHSEDWSSEHSSRILGKFLRKESFYQDKHRRSKKHADEQSTTTEKTKTINRLPPVIAKWKPKLDARLEKDGLFEGLRRCQRGRLEDQRGTEINIELPDFLKDKENTPSSRKKMKKNRKDTNSDSKIIEKETKESDTSEGNVKTSTNAMDLYQTADFKNSDLKQVEEDDNIYANDVLNFGCNTSNPISVFKEPPPLPPKPKNIAWRFSKGPNYGSNSINIESAQKSVYLDQPTSSFV